MKKKKIIIAVICLVILITGIGIVFIPNVSKAGDEEETNTANTIEGYVQRGDLEGTSQASGTTTAGTDYEYMDVNTSTDALLEVEKVYVESGAEVTTQSAILKVTKSSYDSVKAYLEKTLRQEKTALQEAKITYKTELLSLLSSYASDVSTGEIAAESYESTMETLDLQVEQAKEEYEEAKTILTQYPSKIAGNEQKETQKKQALSKLKTQLKSANTKKTAASKEYETAKTNYEQETKEKEEIDIVKNYVEAYQRQQSGQNTSDDTKKPSETGKPREQVSVTKAQSLEKKQNTEQEQAPEQGQTTPDSQDNQNGETTSEQTATASQSSDMQTFIEKVNSDAKERETAYQAAEKTYTTKKTAYEKWEQTVEKKEEAIEAKESAIETLEQTIVKQKEELANAKKEISSLQANYEQAVTNRESKIIEAKEELEQNLLTGDGAEVSYEIELAELEETLQAAQESYDEAKEALELFEESFQDYTWYAKSSGNLSYVGYEEGDYMDSQTPVLGYYNGDIISIEITVDQSEISALSVGDTVTVATTSMPRGTEGVIAKIANTKNSTSASKVTYAVTISVDNTENSVQSGETATVSYTSQTLKNVLYIAQRLVQSDESRTYVTVKEESGETKEVEITTGLETGTFVEIKEGLEEGDCCVATKTKEVHKDVE